MRGSLDISGHCLCGAVAFTAKAETLNVGACHCGMCRRWISGPYLALAVNGGISVESGENIGACTASEWSGGAFCKVCSSTLYRRMADSHHYALSAGALEDQSQLKFADEIFIEDQPAYYAFTNETKRQTGEEVIADFMAEQGEGEQQHA